MQISITTTRNGRELHQPFSGGTLADDLYGIFSQSARFKDGSYIKEHAAKVINKVETILKNHHQSGHH
jgi:penicillin V acylase-like amidase (Ntn superfamily)